MTMELGIVEALDYNLGMPMSIQFLRRYSKTAQVLGEDVVNGNQGQFHNVPNICLVPLCTFARLHAYNFTKVNQSQARIQKRAVGNTYSRRYKK